MTRSVSVLVVGGGISGLVCAYSLQKAGIDVLLVEAAGRLGGVIQSGSRDGFLLELGPQSFSCTSQLRALCRDLGIADQILVAPPRAPRYVLIDGKLHAVPMNPASFFFSPLLSGATKWSLIRDVFGKSAPPGEDESVAAFMRRKFSDELLDRFVGPFVSGVYAGDPESLSLRSAFPILHEAEKAAGSILRGMLRRKKEKKGPRERPTLSTFCEGNETLVHALASKLGPAGRTETRASELGRQSDGSFHCSLEGPGKPESISAKSLVFATPTHVAGKLLSPLDSSFDSLLSPVTYAAVAVVSLGYRRSSISHDLQGFGFLIPRSAGVRTLGTVWNSSLFRGRAPEGYTLLTSFVGGATDPAAAKLSSQELTGLVHREIAGLLGIGGDPAFSNVTVWPQALPQYNLGHADRLASIRGTLSRFPGLFLVGNYLRGPAIGTCVEEALAVAENIRTN